MSLVFHSMLSNPVMFGWKASVSLGRLSAGAEKLPSWRRGGAVIWLCCVDADVMLFFQGTAGPDPTTVYVDMRALRHDR